MKPVTEVRRLAITSAIVIVMIAAGAAIASAQSLGDVTRRLDAVEPQVSQGMSSPAVAGDAITERLESMLNRMYTTYHKKKDACILTIEAGGTCDYDQPEQLALRALYPLSWLRFEGATLYANDPPRARRLLNQAIDGFTDSSLLILSP
ncbi:MAG: hypothetical protein HY269_00035 [Deltaproteobacteria bacterium]|nr:hypothetical protein [Deltaproteobacteria bacterium]